MEHSLRHAQTKACTIKGTSELK